MTIDTTAPAPTDRTERTTKGLLVAATVLGVPQAALAAFIAVATWVEIAGMTSQERADSWAELGYFFAGILAVPPLLALLIGAGAWFGRRSALGTGLAIGAVAVVGLAGLFYVSVIVPGSL